MTTAKVGSSLLLAFKGTLYCTVFDSSFFCLFVFFPSRKMIRVLAIRTLV